MHTMKQTPRTITLCCCLKIAPPNARARVHEICKSHERNQFNSAHLHETSKQFPTLNLVSQHRALESKVSRRRDNVTRLKQHVATLFSFCNRIMLLTVKLSLSNWQLSSVAGHLATGAKHLPELHVCLVARLSETEPN